MNEEGAIEVVVNGEKHKLAAGGTLATLIAQLDLTPQRIAIEHNLEIVPKARWEETALRQGDRLEIVHFVGGG